MTVLVLILSSLSAEPDVVRFERFHPSLNACQNHLTEAMRADPRVSGYCLYYPIPQPEPMKIAGD